MKIAAILFFSAIVVSAAIDTSMLKFKAGHDSVYAYVHSRRASTPQKNVTESCACKVYLRPSNDISNELIVAFKDAVQHYQIVPLKPEEHQQLSDPFRVRLQDNGEVGSILTRANESIKSLTIKYQAMQILLPNHFIRYREILNTSVSNFVVSMDLSYLPFGTCNATGTVTELDQFRFVKVEARPGNCKTLNIGGSLVAEHPEDSRFTSGSFFAKDDFTLQERYQDTNITMEVKDGERRAKIGYHFMAEFVEFKPKVDLKLEEINEEHNLEELQEIQPY